MTTNPTALADEIEASVVDMAHAYRNDDSEIWNRHIDLLAAACAAIRSPVPSEDIEAAARRIAMSQGQDADDAAPLAVMCTADNRPVPWWQVYEEQARAALLSGLSPTAVDGSKRAQTVGNAQTSDPAADQEGRDA